MNNRPRKRSTAEKEVSSWIDAAFAQCEKRYGWSPIDRENVVTYTAIFYLHQRFKADPLLSGADFAALDAYALKLRPNGGEGQPTAEERRAIMTQIAQSGVDASNQPAMTMALDYILSSFHLLSRKNAFAAGKLPEVIARDYIN